MGVVSGAKSLVSGSGVATDTVVNLENTVTVQACDSSGNKLSKGGSFFYLEVDNPKTSA